MIKQLFKIVWNRKRANFLIILEVFISFLVVFAVMAFGVYFVDIYTYPLGFTYQDVWSVRINRGAYSSDEDKLKQIEVIKQLMQSAKEFSEVESIAGVNTNVFDNSESISSFDYAGKKHEPSVNFVTDDMAKVLDIKLLEGRWFSKDDDAESTIPIIINQKLSQELFANESPIGKVINMGSKEELYKIVGLVLDFRDDTELVAPKSYILIRNNINIKDASSIRMRFVPNFIIKLRPGTTAAFEEKLARNFLSIAKDWSFNIQTLEDLRNKKIKGILSPVLAVAIVAVFLMIMVALGLSGVLWQNVTQRIKEIGLRRANGATRGKIYYQILGELLVITSIALTAGTIIVIQFPLPGFFDFVTAKVYIITILLSCGIIALLTIICGLYPSSLAARIPPAEALHYE
ncbi:MAG: ABC transporter permease [Blastocatellia bacterium]|nr:ABC transporter permease [Blastocatellia bacterium]